MQAVGSDDVAVRVLSVLLGTAAIPATYFLGRELVGRRVALLAALLAAASPLYVAYSREAAMYALLALVALMATIGLARYVRDGGWGALAAYGGAMLLALYTHYYALFLLAAQDAYVAWLAWRGELPRGAALRWVAAQAALALCFVPWLPALWRQAGLAASVGDWASPDPVAALGNLAQTVGVGL